MLKLKRKKTPLETELLHTFTIVAAYARYQTAPVTVPHHGEIHVSGCVAQVSAFSKEAAEDEFLFSYPSAYIIATFKQVEEA